MIRSSGALLTVLFVGLGCAEEQTNRHNTESLRFAVMTFAHETCTFDSDLARVVRSRRATLDIFFVISNVLEHAVDISLRLVIEMR